MSLDDRTAQEQLTPEERRAMLRAFADRMLLKATAMDDPEDMPGVEKAMRVAASIERIYYRCDRAERQATDPRKLEAERAVNHSTALKARVALASDLEWGEQRRKQLGKWWDAAQTTATAAMVPAAPQTPTETPDAQDAAQGAALHGSLASVFETFPDISTKVIDYTDRILKARTALGLPDIPPDKLKDLLRKPPSPA